MAIDFDNISPPHTFMFGSPKPTDAWDPNTVPTITASGPYTFDLAKYPLNDLPSGAESHRISPSEMILAYSRLDNYPGSGYIEHRWIRARDGKVLFQLKADIPACGGNCGWSHWYWYRYSFVGHFDWEITEAGAYYVEINTSWGNAKISFEVTDSSIPPTAPPPALDQVMQKLNSMEATELRPTLLEVERIKDDTDLLKSMVSGLSTLISGSVVGPLSSIIQVLQGITGSIASLPGTISGGMADIRASLVSLQTWTRDFKVPDPTAGIVSAVNGMLQPARDVLAWTQAFRWPDWQAAIVQPVINAADVWFSNRLGIDPAKPFWDEIEAKIVAIAVKSIAAVLDIIIPPPPEAK